MRVAKPIFHLLVLSISTLANTAIAQMSLAEMVVTQLDMFRSEPCFDLVVLQDNFANGRTTEFEKVNFWHSYIHGVADILFPERDDRFVFTMFTLSSACLENPELPMTTIAGSLRP